ncbi:MAG: hypothetical protein SO355_11225 [Candidatus Faecousia sp.]|nr:hypothetical protein [Bacillota bacterium]MDY4755889.1 hypothetical protein [Candidatus Faecousia sp.]MDY6160142.1 hypothetical protein [Candidatus Faecousia sp.]
MARNRKKKNNRPYQNQATITVYLVLRALVILTLVRGVFRREYQTVFLCALSLVLLVLPSIISKKMKIVLPSTLEIIILLFVYAAEILGEINSFYVRVPHWDTMLHTINGFLCAAIGFALVDMMNRNDRFSFQLSPLYLAIVSFCFSMTVGVLWEFFEFSGDYFLGMDMQKDTVVNAIHSVNMDPTLTNTVVHIRDITDTILVHSDGTQEALGLGGYLDIGIIDTMKDLFVNFIGAVVFSVIGYFYVKEKGKGKVAHRFIPRVERSEKQEP